MTRHLTSQEAPAAPQQRAIMVVATDPERLDDLLAIAEPLARRPARELILARLLRDDGELAAASAALSERRDALAQQGVASRIAAYTTREPGADAVRLATEHDVDLVLLDAATGAPRERSSRPGSRGCPRTRALRCRVCSQGRRDGHRADRDAVRRRRARLVRDRGGRLARPVARDDAPAPRNRGRIPLSGAATPAGCLSRASMLVQQVVGIVTEPVLVRPGEEGVLEAARDARLLVVGLSDRWRTEGIGHARLAVATGAEVPTLFVRRGLRPSGVAPNETLTRFTWTLGSERS